MPIKHILVCEDVLTNQLRIAQKLFTLLDPTDFGDVEVSFVSGGIAAAGIISHTNVDLIILDHDMPAGSGPELMKWMAANGYKIPIITFSGIASNNDHLRSLGATYWYMKDDVIDGLADMAIRFVLKMPIGDK